MSFGKVLFWGGLAAITVGGTWLWFGGPTIAPSPKPNPTPGPDRLGGWEFAEWTTTATDVSTELPTIVVLHDVSSGAADVRVLFEGLEQPARIFVPLGKFGAGEQRGYIALEGASMKEAQTAAMELQSFLFAVLSARKVTGRIIVIGLGTSGTLAIALANYAGLAVRQAYAVGGLYEPAYVAEKPQAQVRVRMLLQETAPQNVQANTANAFKLMSERGFDAQVLAGDFDLPVTSALAKQWLWPELAGNLLKL